MFKRLPIEHRWSRILFALILTCTVGVQSGYTQSRTRPNNKATPEPSPQPSPTPSPNPLIIPVPQVATEAIPLNQRLRSLPDRIVSDESLANFEQQINELKETTGKRAHETEQAIQSGALFGDLQQSSVDWQALRREVNDLSETLGKQANAVENEIRSLRSEETRWQVTNDAIKSQESPPELLELTSKAVADIGSALGVAEERRDRVVALQQSVTKQSSVVATEIELLKKAMSESQRGLLERDSPPLWKIQFAADDSAARLLLRGTYPEDLTRMRTFVRANSTALILITIITIALLGLFLRLRPVATTGANNAELKTPDSILKRPFSLALLVFAVALMPLLFGAPLSVIGVVNLMGIIPVMRLLKPRLSKPFRGMLVVLVVSVLSWHLIKFVQFPTWIKRDLLGLLTLGTIALFAWLAIEARHLHLNKKQKIVLIGTNVGIAILSIAFLANLFGYIRLSDLFTHATLASAYRAVALYTVVVFGGLLIAFTLQAKPTQHFMMFRTGSEPLVRRLSFALGLAMFLLWVHTTLNLFAVREDVYAAIRSALNYQITIGSAGFAVSNIVAFVLTLFFGYLVASIIRAILGEEILPRLNLARGVPNAIATVSYYIALVLIFVLALAAAGVELTKFTILTGAIGVGLGFGLQNIVNNFVSGLTLLFERPVRVGDFLEIGGIGGQVTKIGFRSSTLHAFDGSDVIIPNADLISQRVINWTLTGTRRQIFLNIHVAYGNDPATVRDLLRETAAAQPDVLDYPKPTALFLGFGDNALNFEVRFWAARPEVVPELKSDVAVSIASALGDAGIKVPVPQRHLHVTGLDRNATDSEHYPPDKEREDQIETEAKHARL